MRRDNVADHKRGKETARQKDDEQNDASDAPHGGFKQMLYRFITRIVRPVDMIGDEVEIVRCIFAGHLPGIIERFIFGTDIGTCPPVFPLLPAGIRRNPGELCQIVFVSVGVNGIFSFGEENKILLWGQERNQPPAGGIFWMFQIAVKKDMAGNFGGTRALGYIFPDTDNYCRGSRLGRRPA